MPYEYKSLPESQNGLLRYDKDMLLFYQTVEARVKEPILKNGQDLWDDEFIHSRSMILLWGPDRIFDGNQIFKIDNEFDLSLLKNAVIEDDIAKFKNRYKNYYEDAFHKVYRNSTGPEFVIISFENHFYMLPSDKYWIYEKHKDKMTKRDFINNLNMGLIGLVNEPLSPDQVSKHIGWQALMHRKNKSFLNAFPSLILNRYIREVIKHDGFSKEGKGMGFYVPCQSDHQGITSFCLGGPLTGYRAETTYIDHSSWLFLKRYKK